MTYRNKVFKGALRDLVIKNKGIFVKAIIAYAESIPDPTEGDTFLPNIHELIDSRDRFKKQVNIPSRQRLLDALFKIGISEYAHDTVYQFFLDWLKHDLEKTPWVYPDKWVNPYWDKFVGARLGK